MRKTVLVGILFVLSCAIAAPGCHWAGRTTGKAVKKIEKGTSDFEQGYDEGLKK